MMKNREIVVVTGGTVINGDDLEFATANSAAILGPSLTRHVSESSRIIKHILECSINAILNMPSNPVDARDFADMHLRAMESPEANGHHLIASAAGQISMLEIAAPDIILKTASFSIRKLVRARLLLKVNRNVSTEKAKNILEQRPASSIEDKIVASVENMIRYDLIKLNK